MPSFSIRSKSLLASDSRGPIWIGAGLCLLVANAIVPAVPVVTAMALAAAGATSETVRRFRGPGGSVVVALNLLVYAGLYALFVGAALHRGSMGADHRLGWLVILDAALSVLPISVAVGQTWKSLLGQLPSA